MKKLHKALALILFACMLCCFHVQASAEGTTIDYGQTASLSLYKYDLTKAEADGAWDTGAYVSTGIYDQSVNDVMSNYAVQGVEFTCLRIADLQASSADENGEHKVTTLYGFTDTAFLAAIGLGMNDAHHTENGLACFSSDTLNNALAAALSSNATTVKNKLEAYVKTGGTAMPVTDEYGHSEASGLELGLYLVVETRVPENVTSTCNPFLVSLPMTTIDGSGWNYDVTVYPKNRTGMPTLEKAVREASADTGKNKGLTNDIADGYAPNASASAGDRVDYQILSTLPAITSEASYLSQYTFVDELSKGITYNKNDVLLSFYKDAACTELLTTWDEASGKFHAEYSELPAGQRMTIAMTETGLAEINGSEAVYGADNVNHGYSDCTMRITYACTLNSEAALVCGDSGNPNNVTLTWSRSNTAYTDTLKSDAHVYSYGIDLTKKFSDGAGKLENVKFLLHNDTDGYYLKARQIDGVYYVTEHAAGKEQATQFVPTREGRIVIKGLEDDTYTATETATDKDYNLLKGGIQIVISAAEGEACPNCHRPLLTAAATLNGKAVEMKGDNSSVHAFVPFTVVNTKGFELPKTGSYGTWMFTVGGVLAMGAAAFMIYRLSKKKNY
ncbi:MAG: SpaH/EbpB family LPXTG-anchored major pilin [Candidatus Limivicinus sp.]